MNTHIVLDISRLLSRAGSVSATGIDRVELAYARHLIAHFGGCLGFAGVTRLGRFGPVSSQGAARFVKALAARWHGESTSTARRTVAASHGLQLALTLRGEAGLHARIRRASDRPVYILVSHHHLDRPALIERLKERTGARFVCFVHDLIPIEFPEFGRHGQAERHAKRILTVARLADGIIVNSDHTRSQLEPWLERQNRDPPILVAPLGVEAPVVKRGPPPPSPHPYFICIGTIEPKKNHLLLFNIWRRLAAELGEQAPRLVLVGRRGWENENIIDMIERSLPIRRLVEEHNALPDIAMSGHLAHARALLLPSFAEGYGLPVAEALSLGTPVICSDLESLRAVGKDVPDYLDPLDAPSWLQAIQDYSWPDSERRAEQLGRLDRWRPPRWVEHFAAVQTLINGMWCDPPPSGEGGRRRSAR